MDTLPYQIPDIATGQLRPLSIVLINNMPDGALHATERHFMRLLHGASGGGIVRLRLVAMPGVIRRDDAAAHCAAFYDHFESVFDTPPDGIIVTGAEPRAKDLRDEPFYPSIGRIADFAEEFAIPVLWSCLAAHGAVLHMDGVQRHRHAQKFCGVFECAAAPVRTPLMHTLPQRWLAPHSRHHGLLRRPLERNGYTILSTTREGEVDMFMRQSGALHLFLQGHPEYAPDTLLLEYRRDLMAAWRRRTELPQPPRGLATAAETRRIAREALDHLTYTGGVAPPVETLRNAFSTVASWHGFAQALFAAWIGALRAHAALTAPPSLHFCVSGQRVPQEAA